MSPPSTQVSVQGLLRRLEDLPAHPNVAMRVLLECNDEWSSATRLGRLIEVDVALTAHVMRLANSAFFGLSNRVANASRAVSVLGLSMVRSIAAGIAIGVLTTDSAGLPPGYWEHSVGTAVACSILAPRVGCNAADAFSMGLLHDVGTALLYRLDPEAYEMVMNAAIIGTTSLVEGEREVFGIAHDIAAGRVLTAWDFPHDLVAAIGGHHHLSTNSLDLGAGAAIAPLSALLAAAEELTRWLPDAARYEPGRAGALEAIGVASDERAPLLEQVVDIAAAVAASVAPLLAV